MRPTAAVGCSSWTAERSATSRYDIRDFVFPVVNGATDRIYLASNNGLIVCLHDKDYAQALLYHKKRRSYWRRNR